MVSIWLRAVAYLSTPFTQDYVIEYLALQINYITSHIDLISELLIDVAVPGGRVEPMLCLVMEGPRTVRCDATQVLYPNDDDDPGAKGHGIPQP